MNTFEELAQRLGIIEGDLYKFGKSDALSKCFATKEAVPAAEIKNFLLSRCTKF